MNRFTAQMSFRLILAMALLPSVGRATESPKPAEPKRPYILGLFIGIDQYPHLDEQYHLHSCVFDARSMQTYFTDEFHLAQSTLLVDDAATRQEIAKSLQKLVEQTREANAKFAALSPSGRPPICVVITYSGHGVQVKRLPSETDSSAQDAAWLCDDSSIHCDQVVRGYELLEIHRQLALLGASVVIISDSCHSGSNYRGFDASESQARTVHAEDPLTPPLNNLFPQFAADVASDREAPQNSTDQLPGFVFYSACSDNQKAYDLQCGDHREGRLTHSLLDVLKNNHGNTTYRDVAAQLSNIFAAQFPDQAPEFHAANGKSEELFLQTGLPMQEAHIVSLDNDQHTIELDLGDLNGIDQKTAFTFYDNMNDLRRDQHQIATGSPTDVQPMSCTVLLDNAARVSTHAVAKFDRPRMAHVVVGVDGEVPVELQTKLNQLAGYQQIRLADPSTAPTLVIHYFPSNRTVGFFPPTSLPANHPSEKDAVPLRLVDYQGPADLEQFCSNLLYEAAVQRVMTLRHDGADKLFSAVIQSGPPDPKEHKIPVPVDKARPPDGLDHIGEDSRLHLELANTSSSALYFTVIGLARNGEVKILFPKHEADAGGLIQPGSTKSAAFLKARVGGKLTPGEAELTRLKVIATDQVRDFDFLEKPPKATSPSRSINADDSLTAILRGSVQGGTRGFDEGTSGDELWQTQSVDFDVIKR
jgi:hypothetical protein